MSKKSFAGGLDSLLSSSSEEEKEEPQKGKSSKKVEPARNETATKDSIDLEDRYTFYLKKTSIEKIQALAWWERRSIKEVANEALEVYFEEKGSKHINHALKEFSKSKG